MKFIISWPYNTSNRWDNEILLSIDKILDVKRIIRPISDEAIEVFTGEPFTQEYLVNIFYQSADSTKSNTLCIASFYQEAIQEVFELFCSIDLSKKIYAKNIQLPMKCYVYDRLPGENSESLIMLGDRWMRIR